MCSKVVIRDNCMAQAVEKLKELRQFVGKVEEIDCSNEMYDMCEDIDNILYQMEKYQKQVRGTKRRPMCDM